MESILPTIYELARQLRLICSITGNISPIISLETYLHSINFSSKGQDIVYLQNVELWLRVSIDSCLAPYTAQATPIGALTYPSTPLQSPVRNTRTPLACPDAPMKGRARRTPNVTRIISTKKQLFRSSHNSGYRHQPY